MTGCSRMSTGMILALTFFLSFHRPAKVSRFLRPPVPHLCVALVASAGSSLDLPPTVPVSSNAQNTGNRFAGVMGSLMITIACFTEPLAFRELLYHPCILASAGRRERSSWSWKIGVSTKLHRHHLQAHPVPASKRIEMIFAA